MEGGAAVCGRGGVRGTLLCCDVDDLEGVIGLLSEDVKGVPLNRLSSLRSAWFSCAVWENSCLC